MSDADAQDQHEPWRDLHVGDRIRMTGIPEGWEQPHAHVPACTRKLVERLVAQRVVVQVHHLDELDMPWILYESFAEDGQEQADFLSIHDLVWERVDDST